MIYFVQAEIGGPVKIGYTIAESAGKRVAELQCGCPWPLKLVFTMPGTPQTEAKLHRRFAHLRVHGEWFEPRDDFIAWLRARAKPGDPLRLDRPTTISPVLSVDRVRHGPLTLVDASILALLECEPWLRRQAIADELGLTPNAVSGRLRMLRDYYGQAVSRHRWVGGSTPVYEWAPATRGRIMVTPESVAA